MLVPAACAQDRGSHSASDASPVAAINGPIVCAERGDLSCRRSQILRRPRPAEYTEAAAITGRHRGEINGVFRASLTECRLCGPVLPRRHSPSRRVQRSVSRVGDQYVDKPNCVDQA